MTLGRKSLYAVLVAVPLLAIFTFGNRGLLKRVELEHEASRLREGLYRERAVGDSLTAEKSRIEHDTTAIERIARERYGMVRPGETIYKVDE
jgi:cell division protein FtsB